MEISKPISLDHAPMSGLDRLAKHLTYHTHREELIAGNLANLDTPGFRPRDLVFHETLTTAMTPDGQMDRSMSHGEELVTRDDETPDQDGNSVSLERQLSQSTANTIRYGAIGEVLNRKLALLRYAVNDGH